MPAYSASHPPDRGWKPRNADPCSSSSSWVPVCHHKFQPSSRILVCPLVSTLLLLPNTSYPSFLPSLVISNTKDFLSHSFCESGTWKLFIWLLWLMASHFRCYPGLQSHLEAQQVENRLPCSLLWLLEGFSSPHVVGLRTSFPYWLLARNSLRYLPHGPLHKEVTSWQLASIRASK